jgi:GT2 family glycosyltransferase
MPEPVPVQNSPEGGLVSDRQISFVIVARDEPPPLLETTVQGLLETSAGHAREIVVVDDGSLVPVSLRQTEVQVVRNPAPMGTARARRHGASITNGGVLVSMDAHMTFAPDWLDLMLRHVESGALLCAAWANYELTRPLCWGADFQWCGERDYIAGRSPGFSFRHRTKHPGDGAVEVPMLIGACYMMLRQSYDRLGGFSPFFRTWGRLEQDLSLRAWIVGLGVKCVSGAHVGHFTRAKFPYAVRWEDVEFNQVATARTVFEDSVARTFEELLQPLPAAVAGWLAQADFREWRQSVQSERRISDAEFFRRFLPDAPERLTLSASSADFS